MVDEYKINIEKVKKLEEKQIFKNYKELALYLEADVLDNHKRRKQIKDWRNYFKFTQRSNGSFIIVEVFENPLSKIDKRADGNNTIYSQLIQLILLDYLSRNIDTESQLPYINLSKTQIYQILGMCNETYVIEFIQKYRQNEEHIQKIQKFKSDNNLSEYDMNDYYERSINKFNSVLNSAFKSLKNKSVVMITDNYIVKEIPMNVAYNEKIKKYILKEIESDNINKAEFDSYMRMFKNTIQRLATDKEKSIIVGATRESMDKLNIKDLFLAYKPYNIDSFTFELNKILFKELNWCLCYKTKTFNFTESSIASGIKWIEKEVEAIKIKRRELNKLLQNTLDKNAVMIYNKSKDDLVEKLLNNEDIFTYKENYMEAQRIISELFMEIEE